LIINTKAEVQDITYFWSSDILWSWSHNLSQR